MVQYSSYAPWWQIWRQAGKLSTAYVAAAQLSGRRCRLKRKSTFVLFSWAGEKRGGEREGGGQGRRRRGCEGESGSGRSPTLMRSCRVSSLSAGWLATAPGRWWIGRPRRRRRGAPCSRWPSRVCHGIADAVGPGERRRPGGVRVEVFAVEGMDEVCTNTHGAGGRHHIRGIEAHLRSHRGVHSSRGAERVEVDYEGLQPGFGGALHAVSPLAVGAHRCDLHVQIPSNLTAWMSAWRLKTVPGTRIRCAWV